VGGGLQAVVWMERSAIREHDKAQDVIVPTLQRPVMFAAMAQF